MTSYALALPVLAPDSGLVRYFQEIKKFPVLEAEEEYMLAKAFLERGDTKAAHKLVTSHLRLVAKIAMGYRGYGLSLIDLISEGNIGLMHAVKKFDPEKGFRLSTYAMWWIKAQIQEFILRSWSLVKMGTTAAQKKLFFNLRRLKHKIDAHHEGDLYPEEVKKIASELQVTEDEVIEMDRRMSGSDQSLNAHVGNEEEDEWINFLSDDHASHETLLLEHQDKKIRKELLRNALKGLNERELEIIKARKLSEEPITLEDLSKTYKISKERVRQIEANAMEKLGKLVLSQAAA